MKPSIRLALLLSLPYSVASAAPSARITDAPSVLPKPAALAVTGDIGFALAGPLKVKAPADEAADALAALKSSLAGGISLGKSENDSLTITLDPTLGKETYHLTVTPTAITLRAGDPAGAYYGVQTLIQSVANDANGKPALPAMEIKDSPRFAWRGLMLDSCRHFIRPENMKRMIDLMAIYKFNRLHWHLTEDQGWRIEIKKYPKLAEIGSLRAESPVVGDRNKGDGKPYGPFFYTQKQIKDIVAYAKAREITIIPEIELPGHALAAVSSYPNLGNDDVSDFAPKPRTRWGVEDYVYSPKEETFQFLDDVMDEVAALFPDAPYIHIGGDECPKTQWNRSPFAQKIMMENGLVTDGKPDSHKLQSWFIQRVEKTLAAHHKKLIGWDEIQEGGLSPTATMMVWRDWKWATMAIKQGNDVIMSPSTHCYLDHAPGNLPADPAFETIGGNLTLEKVYSLNPIPEGLTTDEARHVIGVQGNLWSEYIFNQAKLELLAFPRAIAIAEVGWSSGTKDVEDFKKRLARNRPRLDALKVNYQKPDGTPAQPDAKIVNE